MWEMPILMMEGDSNRKEVISQRFPRWLSGKESCQCRRCRRHSFNPLIKKIPWRRKWQPTAVLLAGKSHGHKSLVGTSTRLQKVGHDLVNERSWTPTKLLTTSS